MTVREDTSLIDRSAAPRPPANHAVDADARLFATKFLYAGLGVGAAVLLAAFSYLLLGASNSWLWSLWAVGLVLLLAAGVFGRLGRLGLAGILVLVTALVGLAMVVIRLPEAAPGALLAATLLIPFALIVVGRQALLATVGAQAALALGLAFWLFDGQSLPLIPLVAAPVFALHGLVMLTVARFIAGNQALARRHDEELARLGRLVEEQRAEQRATNDALELERWRTANLLEQLDEGVIDADAEGRVLGANNAARRIWQGLTSGPLEGQPLTALRDILAAPGEGRAVELLPVGGRQDDTQQYVLIDRRALDYAQRLRTELVELIALKMRNPLTSMLTGLEMTLGEQLPDGTDRVLAGARRSGQELLETVTTLIEINELERSPAVLRRTPSPLRPLIEASIAQATPLAQQRAVNVVVEYNADGTVDVDVDRLRRAMLYLLDNAIRTSPDYSTVQVQTERQGSDLLVRVIDQSPGIEPEELSLLFHRYIVPSDQGNAPALGLTFCRLVVEAHNGRIEVESTAHGSRVTVALPLAISA